MARIRKIEILFRYFVFVLFSRQVSMANTGIYLRDDLPHQTHFWELGWGKVATRSLGTILAFI